MKLQVLTIAALVFGLSGCAPTVPLSYSSASGKPERLFTGVSVEEVKNKIIDGCASRGMEVFEQGTASVTCSKTMTGNDAILGQLLIGNSYSTPPTSNVTFVVTSRGDDTKVMMSSHWIETQMAFGQIRKQQLTANHQLNSVYDFLRTL